MANSIFAIFWQISLLKAFSLTFDSVFKCSKIVHSFSHSSGAKNMKFELDDKKRESGLKKIKLLSLLYGMDVEISNDSSTH